MKKNVLVFPCGSEIGLEIFRSLSYSIHFEVYGGSSVDDHGKYVYPNYVGNMPMVNDPEFADELEHIVKTNKIDLIIPAHDDVVVKLAELHEQGKLGCAVVSSPPETCQIARSKQKTYEALQEVILTPKIYASLDAVTKSDLPIFMKPDKGQGSRGTYKAASQADMEFYIQKDPYLLLLEFLPGKEYTVDCFSDKHGKLRFCEARERRRVLNGISVNTSVVKSQQLNKMAEKINNKLKFRGVWFFQVKENAKGEPVLMEIAPRIAGAMGLSRSRGVNLVLLSLFDALDMDIDIIANTYEITMDRALENSYKHNIHYSHVYLDLDDLVIFGKKINPAVMAFVYQCVNKGVKVHLTTRHKDDLNVTLKDYRLENVFDEVIWIKKGENKADYIKHKDAIFIDDSFAERKAVQQLLDVPTFDAHMIEALMEKF